MLDLRLPEMDGYAVCKALKSNSDTEALPIVILTARAEPSERVHGLELGADDYVTKPFSPRELVLRVQALLRRSRSSAQNYVLEVAEFHVDRNNLDIRLEGKPLDLTPSSSSYSPPWGPGKTGGCAVLQSGYQRDSVVNFGGGRASSPVDALSAPGFSQSLFYTYTISCSRLRTTSTGQGACRTARSAVLPMTTCLIPVRP